MDVRDFTTLQLRENEKELFVYNPLSRDFTWNYDGQPYTIHSKENTKFKAPIAKLIGKHLINEYLQDKKHISEEDRKIAQSIIFGDE